MAQLGRNAMAKTTQAIFVGSNQTANHKIPSLTIAFKTIAAPQS